MKNVIFFLTLSLTFLTCEKNFSPLPNRQFIYFTGRTNNGLYEFRVSNISAESASYWGYGKNHPIYQYAILTNNQWEDRGPGWCRTGLIQYVINSGDSFIVNIAPPDSEHVWRAGIRLYFSTDNEGEMTWSQSLK